MAEEVGVDPNTGTSRTNRFQDGVASRRNSSSIVGGLGWTQTNDGRVAAYCLNQLSYETIILAGDEGFEPSHDFSPNALAVRPLQPNLSNLPYFIRLAGSSHLSYHLYSPSRHLICNVCSTCVFSSSSVYTQPTT